MLWLEESNITDNLIVFVQQNSSKICKKVLEDPGIGIQALSCELNVSASTMKLAFNEDLYYSYKYYRGQLLPEKACEKHLTNAKKLLSKVKHPVEPQAIWFFSNKKNLPRSKAQHAE